MTAGERAIWAAAFVEAYTRRMHDATRLDTQSGAVVPNDRLAARAPAFAALDAARMVRIARDTLPKLDGAEMKPSHEELRREAADMLREMLGAELPYR